MTHLPSFITNPNPRIYLENSYVTLDLETSNLDHGDARNPANFIVYGVLSGPKVGTHEISDISGLYDLRHFLYESSFVVGQNLKFEYRWLQRAGVELNRILGYDTMLAEYCRAGNRSWRLDLDSICKRYNVPVKHNYISNLMELDICPSEMPRESLKKYCQNDVKITEQVMLKQRLILEREGLLNVAFVRNITTPVIADMEMHGLYLDKEEVAKVYKEVTQEYSQAVLKLNEITGGVNMGSPKQVAKFMYTKEGLNFAIPKGYTGQEIRGKPTEEWPEGLPKTDEKTLPFLKATNKKQKEFLELKSKESKLRKQITSYLELYSEVCGLPFEKLKDNKKGKKPVIVEPCVLYGNFNQTRVDTHRLSSDTPNLQNQPRKLKKVVKARKKDWKVRANDYAGLEYRIAGELSQDPVIAEELRNKFDVHSYTASIVFEKDWIAAGSTRKTKEGDELRTEAKKFTFGPLFGKTSGTEEQKAYFEAFKKKYKALTDTQQQWIDECLDTQKLVTLTGLVAYFPGTVYAPGSKTGFVINSTKIRNYPIQMFATADIAPTGVALLWHSMKASNLESFLVAEIHDSVVIEEHPEEGEVIEQLSKKCMEKDIVPFIKQVYGIELNYPMEIETKVSANWQ